MISIIVPIYNVEQYLEQCIESICRQTYRDLEIILVDDGSSDKSAGICDACAAKDSRITVIHKANGGLVSARKAGILASHGRYIGYVDGDDWIEETMYETLLDCLEREQADIAMCGRFEDTGTVSKPVYHGAAQGIYNKKQMEEQIYPNMIVNGDFFEWGIFPGVWDKLFKRECLLPFQMEVDARIRMGEDAVCAWPAILKAERIYVLHACLYHYRQTTSSMVKQIKDSGQEREQFAVLYQTGMRQFEKYKEIYDCTKQWEQYVLFLMAPRADGLYRGFYESEFLFPFPKVKRGMRIVLYGAGTYGQRLYQCLKKSGFCEVVLWADRNYAEFQKMGLPVMPPCSIQADDADQIVVAVTYAKPRMALHRELAAKYGEEKVSVIDWELVFSPESKRALGIVE